MAALLLPAWWWIGWGLTGGFSLPGTYWPMKDPSSVNWPANGRERRMLASLVWRQHPLAGSFDKICQKQVLKLLEAVPAISSTNIFKTRQKWWTFKNISKRRSKSSRIFSGRHNYLKTNQNTESSTISSTNDRNYTKMLRKRKIASMIVLLPPGERESSKERE